MTEIRHCVFFPGGHAAYPQFVAEKDADAAERMNDFYLTLKDAAEACSASSVGFRYSADYDSRTEDGIYTVIYTLRLRRHGRTAAARTLIHRWQDGFLLPPEEKFRRKRGYSRKLLDFLRRQEYNK